MDTLKAQLKAVKVDGELLKAKIDMLNSRLHFITEKIVEIREGGESYFTCLDHNLKCRGIDKTLKLLEEEKTDLYSRRRSHDKDLEMALWRQQEMEEDYSKLVEAETMLVGSMNSRLP